jgi:hypothetical protein
MFNRSIEAKYAALLHGKDGFEDGVHMPDGLHWEYHCYALRFLQVQ